MASELSPLRKMIMERNSRRPVNAHDAGDRGINTLRVRVVEPEQPSEGVPVFGDEAGKLDDSSKALRMQCRKLVLTVACFPFHRAHAIFVSVDAIMPLFSQAWGLIRDGKATVVHESVQDYVYETYKGK